MTPATKLPVRYLLGLSLAFLLGFAHGCAYRDTDVFIEHFAQEICRINRDCDRGLKLPGQSEALSTGDACEDEVINYYMECGERCTFKAAKARRCMRRIRRRDCTDLNSSIPNACDEAFVGCTEGDACRAPSTCSVNRGTGPLDLALLSLLGLLPLARRRRR
jgi:hypothetical protein